MLDIAYIRDNQEKVSAAAKNKNIEVELDKLLELDDKRRSLLEQIEDKRRQRNEHAANFKKSQTKPSEEDIAKGKALKSELAGLEEELNPILDEYQSLLKAVPNVATDDTPVGLSEDENVVEYEWGDKPQFGFEPKNHWEIAEERDWIDKERAAKVTGSRFSYLKGDLVLLQFAIIQFTLAVLTDETKLKEAVDMFKLENVSTKPFTPLLPPHLLRTDVFDAMDRLEPREDRYKIEDEDLWLQGSAEHVMGSAHMDEVIDEDQLPIRYVGYATSFRREAGSYGKDLEGIIRMHQFDKLEMEILSVPEQGLNEHLFTVAIQEYLLRALNLPYHKLLKCTADIGKPNARGVDMEVWLPGQQRYRETHTADFMTDYQARRLQTRVRRSQDSSVELVHTIDATAFALGRTLVGIIENYQTEYGRVRVPPALQPYMNHKEVL